MHVRRAQLLDYMPLLLLLAACVVVQWTLPFAVQPPFLDLRAKFVSKPDWYFCSSWAPKRDSLLREIDTGTPHRIFRIDFDQATGRFVSN
jgi:hypothetical protein